MTRDKAEKASKLLAEIKQLEGGVPPKIKAAFKAGNCEELARMALELAESLQRRYEMELEAL